MTLPRLTMTVLWTISLKRNRALLQKNHRLLHNTTENFEITATEIAWNITLSYDVAMVKRFERGLRFIHEKLTKYVQDNFRYTLWTRMSMHGVYRCRRYFPLLLKMQIYDCQSLLGAVILLCPYCSSCNC